MVLKLPWPQKWIFWAFEKGIFLFFPNFSVTKLKPFSGKVRQSVQNYLNQKLIIQSFSENGFQTTLRLKTDVLGVWKGHFWVVSKLLSAEVETVFSENEETRSKLLKSKFDRGNFLENGFEVTLSSKTNFLSVWKGHFSVFSKLFSNEVKAIFLKSEAKRSKLFK